MDRGKKREIEREELGREGGKRWKRKERGSGTEREKDGGRERTEKVLDGGSSKGGTVVSRRRRRTVVP